MSQTAVYGFADEPLPITSGGSILPGVESRICQKGESGGLNLSFGQLSPKKCMQVWWRGDLISSFFSVLCSFRENLWKQVDAPNFWVGDPTGVRNPKFATIM